MVNFKNFFLAEVDKLKGKKKLGKFDYSIFNRPDPMFRHKSGVNVYQFTDYILMQSPSGELKRVNSNDMNEIENMLLSGWEIRNPDMPEDYISEANQRNPENIPGVLRDIPEIMNDIDGFEEWFFANKKDEFNGDEWYDGLLMDLYGARIEDYNEGEGLEWDEAQEEVDDMFKDWANEYLAKKLILAGLKKRAQKKQQ